MAQFTTDLGKRDPAKFALTKAEAMLQLGFRFSEFNLENDKFTLSFPHAVIRQLDRGIISFEQG